MIGHVAVLLAGLAGAAAGGELFVRGAAGLAAWLRIPAGIIGATVVAFATSSPELAVSVASGMAGTPSLALGDALGSNVVNVGLVLGAMLLVGTVATTRNAGLRRDALFALALPTVLAVLSVDGRLSRADGAVLLVIFALWLALTTVEARRERSAVTARAMNAETSCSRLIAIATSGAGLLILAGRLIVSGARPLGAEMGLDPFVLGVVVVAVGTSVPELATALIAQLRGHAEIGLGNVLGSNIFNGGFIIGLLALVFPMSAETDDIEVSLAFGIGLVALIAALGTTRLTRPTGVLLTIGYVTSVVALLATSA